MPLKSDPRAAQWLADSIDVCKSLGLTVSMAACFYNGDLDLGKTAEIDHLVGVLKDIAPKAEKQGISSAWKITSAPRTTCGSSDRVGSPAVKVYYDVGNSTDKGRDVCHEIRTLGKLICELHAKDNGYMLGQGRIDFKKFARPSTTSSTAAGFRSRPPRRTD